MTSLNHMTNIPSITFKLKFQPSRTRKNVKLRKSPCEFHFNFLGYLRSCSTFISSEIVCNQFSRIGKVAHLTWLGLIQMISSNQILKLQIKNSEIPSIGVDQKYPTIKIKSLSAMNKAGTYDDTLAYFVAGIKYKRQWYTENLATINGRKIGPGTIIIDSESNMRNIRQAAISEDISNRSIWRHLLADYLSLDPELPDIERIELAQLIL